ncbi:hypothetical protein DESPIGER_1194 [Desulfovibrio piger]|uniref:Uncharacterized protein n=1 Tax=Desulfovibrio piger TaxID=901 RepID=A0A1K1LEB9_9BACT|nr:hypothetical protein DESPIGER_1194 [Desulfovibrio piger]
MSRRQRDSPWRGRAAAGRPVPPQGHTKLGRECLSTGSCPV